MDFFTNTFEVTLTTHEDLKKERQPVYEFKAATIKERRAENKVSKWLSDIIENHENDVVDPLEYIEAVEPLIKNRLLGVRIGRKRKADLMDLEGTLDYTSIIELYMSMRLQEEARIADKKKLRLLSNLNTGESAKPVQQDATEPQGKKARSSSLNAQDVTETDATNAEALDGSN